MLNILHVAKITYNNGDGITSVVRSLSREQAAISDVKVDVLSLASDDPVKAKKEFGGCSLFYLIKKVLRDKPSIVVFHGVFYPKYILACIFLNLFNVPYAFMPHCSLKKSSMKKGWLKKKVYFKALLSFVFKRSVGVVYLNEDEKCACVAKSFFRKSAVVQNGVSSVSDELKSFEKIKVFYLGRIDIFHKGLDGILQEFSVCVESGVANELTIYGCHENNRQVHELRALIHSYGLEENVILKPPVFGRNKELAFSENNIFVMLSRYEGMPVSVLEALSFGNICLLSPETNMADIVQDNKCGFKINSELNLKSAIEKIVSSEEMELLEMSQNARSLIVEQYLWPEIAKKSIDKYLGFLEHSA